MVSLALAMKSRVRILVVAVSLGPKLSAACWEIVVQENLGITSATLRVSIGNMSTAGEDF